MALELYDSKTARLVEFSPLVPGQVSIYVCGPTVQSNPHLGHLRSALVYDILSRWFQFNSYQVTLVRNVTDIDDKVLANAINQGIDWRDLAQSVEETFNSSYLALGLASPTHTPHATDHISEMIAMVKSLIEKGHAYQALDGSANVFFDTRSWPSYGELTNQNLENLEGEAETSFGRRNPADFALFKAHKDDEPASAAWQTPWGLARPGWHIECSAMAKKYLGTKFDIHGGGLDLRFPHHENELAQSRAYGDDFANLWMHNALVTVQGQKMSKSLGNGVTVEELTASGSWADIRYWLSTAHYRSNIDFNKNSLSDSHSALERISSFIRRAKLFSQTSMGQIPDSFRSAMEADLNVPAAIAVLHETVRAGNIAIDTKDSHLIEKCLAEVLAMTDVLGLLLEQEIHASPELTKRVEELVALRTSAKNSGDYARADQIRAELTALGVSLEDLPNQTIWSING